MVLPADKCRASIVLDTETYRQKINKLLSRAVHIEFLKRQSPDYAHGRASSVFSSKDYRTVILTRQDQPEYQAFLQDFLPDRTTDGDLLFIFSRNILDFRRSLLSYIKFGSRFEDLSRFYRQQGRLATQKSRSAHFKNIFSNLKLVSEVNCSKSSNICLICSRSGLKRLKDINKQSNLNAMNHHKGQSKIIPRFHGSSFS